MTKNKLYIISAIALIVAITLPICLSLCGKESLNVIDSISTLIGALCGAITLLIAILLYNKYGIDQSVADKNLKVVLDIVEELRKTVVFVQSKSKDDSFFLQLNFGTTDSIDFSKVPFSTWSSVTIYFSINYAYAFEHLFELGRDPFAPKEIATAISGIEFNTLSEVNKADKVERSAIVFARLNEKVEYPEIVGKFNGQDMSLIEFIQRLQSVKKSIKLWLISQNVDEDNLNF